MQLLFADALIAAGLGAGEFAAWRPEGAWAGLGPARGADSAFRMAGESVEIVPLTDYREWRSRS
jgi:hypothetical protein